MNGEEFYEAFKNALKYLGLSWGEQAKMQVRLEGTRIVFTHGVDGIFIELERGKE